MKSNDTRSRSLFRDSQDRRIGLSRYSLLVLGGMLLFLPKGALGQMPLTHAFTYQGQIEEDGAPIQGPCDFRFDLWDDAANGAVLGTVTITDVDVINGIFTVMLDFGAGVFDGDARWLEIAVRYPAGSGSYATLSPRQMLTATPYGLFCLDTQKIGGAPVSTLAPVPGEVLKWDGSAWTPNSDDNTAYSAGNGLMLNGTVLSIADGGVTNAMLSPDSVTWDKIADGTIVAADLASGAVTLDKISSSGAGAGQALVFDGASVVWSNPAVPMPLTLTGDFPGGFVIKGSNSSSNSNSYAIYGECTATSGTVSAGYFVTSSASGRGVFGYASGTSGTNYGGWFETESDSGRAVYGLADASTGTNYGGWFETDSVDGRAVYGKADASSGTNYGGYFESDSDTGRGVFGLANRTTGENYGVYGRSDSTDGYGVYGHATAATGGTYGGYFKSDSASGVGIYGETNSNKGVYGYASDMSGTNYGGHFVTESTSGRGVYGLADAATGTNYGGWFETDSVDGRAVYGKADASTGTNYGGYFVSDSPDGYGGFFQNNAGGIALKANGTAEVTVLQVLGSDVAEHFEVTEEAQPGMVVAIDPNQPGSVRLAKEAYDRKVAGIISGANELAVGMILANLPGAKNSVPVALSGRVWTYCDATETAIEPGDLLTTSDRPGYAMSVQDHARAQGAILGKAMSRLDHGQTGLVLVLVNLQ